MKKLLILAASAMALSAAPAIAQVFPSPGTDNSAKITQEGNNNQATIDQAVGGIINGQGLAEIIQSRNNARATITQTTATSPATSGFANEALIDQRRNGALATVNQIHDYATGFGNSATVVQIAANAEGVIRQRGDRNNATLRQLNGSSLPVGAIQQNGINNRAIVRQGGASGYVDVVQGNYVAGPGVSPETIAARTTIDNLGDNSSIFVTQIGQGSQATVYEDGQSGLVNISMYGDFNTADVEQYSTNGVVAISTYGGSFFNTASVLQEVSDFGSSALIDQRGSFAVADVAQRDSGGLGGNNVAEVDQSGAGLGVNSILSTIDQNGGFNAAYVDQASAYAQSSVVQMGTGHTSMINQ